MIFLGQVTKQSWHPLHLSLSMAILPMGLFLVYQSAVSGQLIYLTSKFDNLVKSLESRHCEERSDEAPHEIKQIKAIRVLRFARNDSFLDFLRDHQP
jgi:hypothetical protein